MQVLGRHLAPRHIQPGRGTRLTDIRWDHYLSRNLPGRVCAIVQLGGGNRPRCQFLLHRAVRRPVRHRWPDHHRSHCRSLGDRRVHSRTGPQDIREETEAEARLHRPRRRPGSRLDSRGKLDRPRRPQLQHSALRRHCCTDFHRPHTLDQAPKDRHTLQRRHILH